MEFYYHDVDKDVLILSADGGLLSDNAHYFVGELEKFVEAGARKLIVDCTQLKKISSYGIGVLITLHRRLAKQGGDVKLACVTGIISKVIHVSGLESTFQIYPKVDDARRAFASESPTHEPD
jgi:anti-anti-sigma factor